MTHVHAAVERPETMEALIRKQSDGGDEQREGLIMLNEKHKVSVVNYQKHVNRATFMHFQDSYSTWNALRKEVYAVGSEPSNSSN